MGTTSANGRGVGLRKREGCRGGRVGTRGEVGLPAGLPGHLLDAGDGPRRRGGRPPRRQGPPVHPGVPVREDGQLPRPGLQPGPPQDAPGPGRPQGRGEVRGHLVGRGARADRRGVRRDRRVARRPAGDPPLQLLRDDGQAPGEQPRPPVLPPTRGVDAGPDDLRLGRVAGVRVHRRPWSVRRRPDGRREVQADHQLGVEHRPHQRPPLEPDGPGPPGRCDAGGDRPVPEPHRRAVRLAHPAPARGPTRRWPSG